MEQYSVRYCSHSNFIDKYVKSLKKKNTMTKQLHMSNSCISNPIENGVSITIESCDVYQVDSTFRPLDNLLADEDEYHPIFLTDIDIIQSMDKRMRYKYFKSLQTTSRTRRTRRTPVSIHIISFGYFLHNRVIVMIRNSPNLSPKYPRTYQSPTPAICGLHFEKRLVRWCQPNLCYSTRCIAT